MKTKFVEHFCYEGLGFPVDLEHVEMVEIDNDWHPKIDVRKIADAVIEALAYQEGRLTGNQVRFIRSYFSMSLRKFGEEVVHETHAAVDKWERCGDEMTSMNDNTEYVLRLYILEQVRSKTKKQQNEFFSKYQKIKNFFNSKQSKPVHIHIEKYA